MDKYKHLAELVQKVVYYVDKKALSDDISKIIRPFVVLHQEAVKITVIALEMQYTKRSSDEDTGHPSAQENSQRSTRSSDHLFNLKQSITTYRNAWREICPVLKLDELDDDLNDVLAMFATSGGDDEPAIDAPTIRVIKTGSGNDKKVYETYGFTNEYIRLLSTRLRLLRKDAASFRSDDYIESTYLPTIASCFKVSPNSVADELRRILSNKSTQFEYLINTSGALKLLDEQKSYWTLLVVAISAYLAKMPKIKSVELNSISAFNKFALDTIDAGDVERLKEMAKDTFTSIKKMKKPQLAELHSQFAETARTLLENTMTTKERSFVKQTIRDLSADLAKLDAEHARIMAAASKINDKLGDARTESELELAEKLLTRFRQFQPIANELELWSDRYIKTLRKLAEVWEYLISPNVKVTCIMRPARLLNFIVGAQLYIRIATPAQAKEVKKTLKEVISAYDIKPPEFYEGELKLKRIAEFATKII